MPPLTVENATALLPGGGMDIKEIRMLQQKAAQQNPMQKVKVLRAFYYQGKPIEKDSVAVLPKLFAVEMKAANKVEFVAEEPVAPAAPVQPAKADDAGKKEKGNAR